jgi:hypothetical protein
MKPLRSGNSWHANPMSPCTSNLLQCDSTAAITDICMQSLEYKLQHVRWLVGVAS